VAESNVSGEIVFGLPVPEDLSKAIVYVRLEDTSLADVPSRVVSEQRLMRLPERLTSTGTVPFNLHAWRPDPKSTYSVSVHVDVDRDGKVSRGDYINTESYPVLTFGHTGRASIRVQQV
jgi:uncharacterized lipoprotein YbaY